MDAQQVLLLCVLWNSVLNNDGGFYKVCLFDGRWKFAAVTPSVGERAALRNEGDRTHTRVSVRRCGRRGRSRAVGR